MTSTAAPSLLGRSMRAPQQRLTLVPRCRPRAIQARYASSSSSASSSTEGAGSSDPSPSPGPSTTTSRRRRSDLARTGVDLVAPPDPLSNIRPVIYASTPPRLRSSNSPYSASEFPSSSASGGSNTGASISGLDSGARLAGMELEWRLRRERVDLMNHRFWATVNTSFNAQLAHRLSLLPKPSDPPSPADLKRREDCLSQFYADWQIANRDSQIRWVKEWWREVWVGLRMQGRIYLARALGR